MHNEKYFKIEQKKYENMLPCEDLHVSYFYRQSEIVVEIVKQWIQNNFEIIAEAIRKSDNGYKMGDFVSDRLIECIARRATIGARTYIAGSRSKQAKQEILETLLRLELDENITSFICEEFENKFAKNNEIDAEKFAEMIISRIKSEFEL
jgi:hypothetical protein